MTMPARAFVNPTVLGWARKRAGVSVADAARRAGVKDDRLALWENGEAQPTLRQLRLLARMYRRPTAMFYLATPPETPPEIADYRLLPDEMLLLGDSPNLLYGIRRAQSRRAVALDLLRVAGEEPPSLDLAVRRDQGPEAAGSAVRRALDVDLSDQFGWATQYQALRAWSVATESAGVLVFQFSGVEVQEARGFSLGERPLPVVALNGSDSVRGRIFTLMHELAHVGLNAAGLCDLRGDEAPGSIEQFCNAAAAETLVPSAAFLADNDVLEHQRGEQWADEVLARIADRYMVSQEVILRRLLEHGLTTRNFYREKRRESLDSFAVPEKGRGGFLPYFRRVLRDNGRAYTELVLSAYDHNAISARDLSRHLGDIKLAHVESIRDALDRTAG